MKTRPQRGDAPWLKGAFTIAQKHRDAGTARVDTDLAEGQVQMAVTVEVADHEGECELSRRVVGRVKYFRLEGAVTVTQQHEQALAPGSGQVEMPVPIEVTTNDVVNMRLLQVSNLWLEGAVTVTQHHGQGVSGEGEVDVAVTIQVAGNRPATGRPLRRGDRPESAVAVAQ